MNGILSHWGKTRSCKPSALWIYTLVAGGLLAFFRPTCYAAATVPMRLHLISVSDDVQGTEIELNIVGAGDESEYFSRPVKAGRLSPACGNHFERCKKLMTVEQRLDSSPDDPTVQLVPFIPVEWGLFLVDVRADSDGIKIQDTTDVIPSDASNPAAIYETRYRPQLASIEIKGDMEAVFHFYDIIFNISSIHRTELSKIHSLPVDSFNLSEVSNFVYVSLLPDDDSQRVCLAVSNLLISFNPFSVNEDSVELPSCIGGYRLSYARKSLLMATCHSGSVAYVDLDVMKVVNHTLPTEHPYSCPDPNVDLKVYPAAAIPHILYYLWAPGRQQFIALRGRLYASGHCFGTETLTVFTYEDKEQGMYGIKLTPNSETVQLSSAPCPSSGCYPWAVFKDQYLLVPEGEGIESLASVVDCMDKFSTIIRTEYFPTDMVSIAELPTNSKPNPPSNKQDKGFDKRLYYTALSLLLLPIAAVICIISAVYWCYKRRKNENGPYSRLSSTSSESTPSPNDNSENSQALNPQLQEIPPTGGPDPAPSDSSTPQPEPVSPPNDTQQTMTFTSAQDGGRDGLPQSIEEVERHHSSLSTLVHVAPTSSGLQRWSTHVQSTSVDTTSTERTPEVLPPSASLKDQLPQLLSADTPADLEACAPDSTAPHPASTDRMPEARPPSVSPRDQVPQLLSAGTPADLEASAPDSTATHPASTDRMPEARPPSVSPRDQLPQVLSSSTPANLVGYAPDSMSSQPASPVQSVGVTTEGLPPTLTSGPSSVGVAPGCFLPWASETINKRDLKHSVPENRQNDQIEKAHFLQNPGCASRPPPEEVSDETMSEESEDDPNPL